MSVRSCTSLQDSQELAAILSFEVASMADPSTSSSLGDLTLDAETYVTLLGRFISVADQVQNAPSIGFIPRENVISDLVLAELSPYSAQNGGPLTVERVEYVEGRGNVIITYQHPEDRAAYASSKKSPPTIAFMGSHMDVVPADPETWERNPFSLVVEGDRLYGRGTTDCLGHVALMTQLFIELAKRKVKTKSLVVCVLIASEENTEIPGVGVETLMEKGRLDFLKDGPVIWTDSSNSQPRIGTAGVIAWTLTATGKLFHSGLPNQGINAIELAMDAVTELQKRFYADFGPVEEEKAYNYACPSTMKPARAESAPSGLNQIPPWAKITGDVRLSPFYDMQEMIAKVKSYVDDLNADLSVLEGERGPSSKYVLPGGKVAGHLQIEFEPSYFEGIACSLEALSYKALYEAIEHVKGEAKPFSISGSLPLVRDLQRAGFDLILIGFGLSTVYHADNEYCLLSDMQDALKILARTIANVENSL